MVYSYAPECRTFDTFVGIEPIITVFRDACDASQLSHRKVALAPLTVVIICLVFFLVAICLPCYPRTATERLVLTDILMTHIYTVWVECSRIVST